MASKKAQAILEHMISYIWAIIIIAVVLGVLYRIGVFSPSAFTAKAQPGSCQVYRPNGPYTSTFLSLEGTCNNQIPQYVAQFNGQNGYIHTTIPTTATSGWTVEVWIDPTKLPQSGMAVHNGYDNGCLPTCNGYGFGVAAGTGGGSGSILTGLISGVTYCNTGYTFRAANTWYDVVMTSVGGSTTFYVNGVQAPNICSGTPAVPTNAFYVGQEATGYYFTGELADVQVYNTSLSANEADTLYLEGIGGVPINLQNLVGWWPLNGNSNDYSGNGYNGTANTVGYSGSWYTSYTLP